MTRLNMEILLGPGSPILRRKLLSGHPEECIHLPGIPDTTDITQLPTMSETTTKTGDFSRV